MALSRGIKTIPEIHQRDHMGLSHFRVLLVIAQAKTPMSLRRIAMKAWGNSNTDYTWRVVQKLEQKGLVSRVRVNGRVKAGIYCTCQIVLSEPILKKVAAAAT